MWTLLTSFLNEYFHGNGEKAQYHYAFPLLRQMCRQWQCKYNIPKVDNIKYRLNIADDASSVGPDLVRDVVGHAIGKGREDKEIS